MITCELFEHSKNILLTIISLGDVDITTPYSNGEDDTAGTKEIDYVDSNDMGVEFVPLRFVAGSAGYHVALVMWRSHVQPLLGGTVGLLGTLRTRSVQVPCTGGMYRCLWTRRQTPGVQITLSYQDSAVFEARKSRDTISRR